MASLQYESNVIANAIGNKDEVRNSLIIPYMLSKTNTTSKYTDI